MPKVFPQKQVWVDPVITFLLGTALTVWAGLHEKSLTLAMAMLIFWAAVSLFHLWGAKRSQQQRQISGPVRYITWLAIAGISAGIAELAGSEWYLGVAFGIVFRDSLLTGLEGIAAVRTARVAHRSV